MYLNLRYLVVVLSVGSCFASAESGGGATALQSAERLAWLRNWTAALPYYVEAERQFEAAGDKRNALFVRVSRLRAEADSHPYLETSQDLAALLDDPLVQTDLALRLRCLVVKGDLDLERDTDLARRDWSEVRSVAEKLGQKAWVNRADAELSIVSYLSGDFTAAVAGMVSAVKKARELDDVGSLVRYEALAGDGLLQWKDYDKALKFFDDALSIASKQPDIQQPLLVYSGKIEALISLDRTQEAKKLLDVALAEAKAKSAIGYQAELHLRYGLLESKRGARSLAIDELREAIRLADSVDAQRISGQGALTLAECLEAGGDLPGAQQAILRSIDNARLAGDRLLLPAALAEAGRINVAMGRLAGADQFFEEATDIASGIIASVPTMTAKDEFIASLDGLYLDHFRLHAKLRDTAGAFRILEQARGRVVADALRGGGSGLRPLTARMTEPEKRIAQLQFLLMRSRDKAERQRLLAALERSEEEVFPALVSHDGKATAKPSQPVTLAELQRDLPAGRAVLEYFLAEPRSYCLFVTRDHSAIIEIPGKADISKAVDAHLSAIEHGSDLSQPGRELFDALLPPGATAVPNLIVVPDGPLHRLPFDTVVDENGKLLIATHTVWYAPSGTVLHLLAHRQTTSPPTLPLLAVAAGVDGIGQPSVPVRRNMFDIGGSSLPPLPAANSEARLVGEIMGPASVVITGPAATGTAVKKQPLASYRVLHFAVHGLTSPERPERAGLVFYPDNSANQDGLWQLRDIARSKLQADLVTLSACRAGSGKVIGTAGVANLTTAFLAAGAKSVVANLWDSDDTFTRALMGSFYKHLAQKLPAAEALRRAKLEMQERYGSQAPPQMWAGFTLTGLNGQIFP
jgi:CHAT domain-containing protein/tetratricopeptide (TPR) repeat protein